MCWQCALSARFLYLPFVTFNLNVNPINPESYNPPYPLNNSYIFIQSHKCNIYLTILEFLYLCKISQLENFYLESSISQYSCSEALHSGSIDVDLSLQVINTWWAVNNWSACYCYYIIHDGWGWRVSPWIDVAARSDICTFPPPLCRVLWVVSGSKWSISFVVVACHSLFSLSVSLLITFPPNRRADGRLYGTFLFQHQ